MMYVDTHCHLDLFKNIGQICQSEDLLPIKTITVTNSPSFFKPNEKLFTNAHNIRVGLGMHPELSLRFQSQIPLFDELITRTKYVGEIGLDGSRDFQNYFKVQKSILESILNSVKQHDNKILTVHTRNATAEAIDILRRHLLKTNCRVILHWYSGTKSELITAVNSGFYFSINHKMTSSKKGRELIEEMPIDRILTETDAPFSLDEKVTSRIQSLDIALSEIATIKGISKAAAKETIYVNFARLLKSVNS